MDKRTKKNNLIILGLCCLLVLMGIGYAAFSSKLNITGTSNISSTWDVRITNIESELHGAEDIEEPSYDNTNGLFASFNTGLKRPGDYALYTVTIENRGSVDARIEKINTYYKENKYITFTLSGITKGDVIKGKETKELQVKVEFNSDVTSIEENISVDLDVSIDVAQDSDNPLPANDYYVTYDYSTNGGESTNAINDYVAEGSNVNLEYAATKAGYEFIGWNTDKGAVTGLDSYSMPSNNVTLYAIFRKIDTTPPVVSNVSTSSTTNSITIVTTAIEEDGEIVKYEYKIDNEEYVAVDSNTYTFTGLTQNTNHTVKVKVTNRDNLQVESEEYNVSTKELNVPTFSEEETDNGKTVTITYPEGEGLTYEYQKDGGLWTTATQVQQVEFTESGILVARVSDGTNVITSSTYTVEIASLGSDLVESAGVVSSGDGLYKDSYEENVYTYRGSNPNNYVSFNNNLWRIVNVNTNTEQIKLIKDTPAYNDMQFDSPDNSNRENAGYCNRTGYSYFGCNLWGSRNTLYDINNVHITQLSKGLSDTLHSLPNTEASINTFLNTTYYNDSLSAEAKLMIIEGEFDVGIIEDEANIYTAVQQSNAVKWKGKIGLLDGSEYLRISLSSSCSKIGNEGCAGYNYLAYSSEEWYTISPKATYNIHDANFVWYIETMGKIDATAGAVQTERSIVPVINLSPEVKIISGDGSESSPYKLEI